MSVVRIACAATLLLVTCVVAEQVPADSRPAIRNGGPSRIVSLNLCADQLLMALVPPEHIAAITWLSRSEGDPALAAIAAKIPVIHGGAEEVLSAHPDLVIAGRFTTGTTRRLLRQAGVPLLEIEPAVDWEGIRRTTRQIALAVHAIGRGEAMLAEMDSELARLQLIRGSAPVRAIGWGGAADDVPGRDTVFNTILESAGAVNLGAREEGFSSFDVEQVLRMRPQVLLRGAAYSAAPALRNVIARHPALRSLHYRDVSYPEAVFGCAVPRAATLAVQLAEVLRTVDEAPR